jgi:hypothetical protein
MVSHLFYYQLTLLALVWLFLMLHVTWRKRGVTPHPRQPSLSLVHPSAPALTSPNRLRA